MSDWEDAPSSNDWEDAPAPKGAVASPTSSILKKGLGGLEAGANALSGMAALPLAVGFGALGSLNNLTQGKTPLSGKELEDIQRTFTYEPRTAEGKDMAEDLATSGFMQSLNAVGGVAHTMPPARIAPKIPRGESGINAKAQEILLKKEQLAKANEGWETAGETAGRKANDAVAPEVRAAQETLNAQDAGGNTDFVMPRAEGEAVGRQIDPTAQKELPFTNDMPLEPRQGDLFADSVPTPPEVPKAPVEAPVAAQAAYPPVARMVVPKGQRGAAPIINDMAEALIKRGDAINKILGEKLFTPTMKGEDIVNGALAEGGEARSINNLEAGSTLAAMKRNSTLVREASRVVQNELKQADLATTQTVLPMEQAVKRLSRTEVKDLADVFKTEMNSRHAFSAEDLTAMGMSEKQMRAYAATREMFNKAYEAENAQRIAQGKDPITKQEAYLSSRWQGDYRLPVLDAAGKLKWYLAADSRYGLNKQLKALQKEFPDLKPGKPHTVSSGRGMNDVGQTLSTAIDILGRDDPAVAKIKEWAEQNTVDEGRSALAQEKHFENKANVRGFVGDRPGMNPKSEAIAMFQQQAQYAKNAQKWAALQKVSEQLKDVLNNSELMEQQPNNVAYMKDYIRNQMGMGEAKFIRSMEDAIRDAGVSPHLIGSAVGGMKTFFILQKMAMSLGYGISNVIQFTQNLPHMVDMSKNPVKLLNATAVGLATGPLMATAHYMSAKGSSVYKTIGTLPNGEFLVKAMKYAEDNGVTARSVLDEAPIADSFSTLGRVENIAGKSLSLPETYLRSASYMTYVQLLKDSKKFTNDLELFRAAEEAVNVAMGDYRQGEKALMFSKLGTTGNALNTLQTYPMNYYQQYSWAARQGAKGNVAPIMTMLATQYMVAGAMGIPGFNDATKLWDWIKEKLPTSVWAKVKDVDPKEMLLRAGGEGALYGELSHQTGLGLTSRVTAPGAGEMITAPGGPIVDIAKQIGSLGSLATDPTSPSKQTQAVMNSVPTGLQGLTETTALRDRMSVPQGDKRVYRSSTDVADRKGVYARTPLEETIRSFGIRSQKEVMEKEQVYRAGRKVAETQKRVNDLPDAIYDAARDGRTERVKDLMTLYTQLSGKGVTDEQMKTRVLKEFTDGVQKAAIGAKTIEALKAYKQMQEFLEARQ